MNQVELTRKISLIAGKFASPVHQNDLLSRVRCDECELRKSRLVPTLPRPDSKFIIVGEAPSKDDVLSGRLFTGRAGQLLDSALGAAGVRRDEVFTTNVCLCKAPDGESISIESSNACSDRLKFEIDDFPKDIPMLVLGGSAFEKLVAPKVRELYGTAKPVISMSRGRWLEIDGRNVLPTYHPQFVIRFPDLFRDFLFDIQKLSRPPGWITYPHLHQGPIIHVLDTPLKAQRWLQSVISSEPTFWVTDIETTSDAPWKGRILSYGFCCNEYECFIIPDSSCSEVVEAMIADFLRLHSFGAHNVGFEYIWFKYHLKVDSRLEFDSMLAHYSIDERSGGDEENSAPSGTKSYHNLKLLSEVYFDLPDHGKWVNKFFSPANGFEDCPRDLLYRYQAQDCVNTLALKPILEDEMMEEETQKLHDTLFVPACKFLSRVEMTGFKIDIPYLNELDDSFTQRIIDGERKLYQMVGDEFNLRSPKQVSAVLFDKLKLPRIKGNSTDAEVMVKLVEMTGDPRVQQIVDIRQIKQIQSTYIRGILKRVDSDGRVHTSFLLFGAATGRLASRDPNLQNIPIMNGPEIRRAFIADDGWGIFNGDYSQLELRVLAHLSLDPALVNIFQMGYDIHGEVALAITGKTDPKSITRGERDAAKCLNFGIPYGRQADSVADQLGLVKKYIALGMTPKEAYKAAIIEAQGFIRAYLDRFPTAEAWLKGQIDQAHNPGYSVTPNGRRRRFPLITGRNSAECERQAINAPIQGFASDICLEAGMRADKWMDPNIVRIQAFVHDSIVGQYRLGHEEEVIESLLKEMSNVQFESPVPFVAVAKIGASWGDAD